MYKRQRNKCVLLLGTLLLSFLFGCSSTANAPSTHTVTLIAKSTETEFWLSVFAGAEAAAAEYNMNLKIVGPKTEEDYETQNQMVADTVEAVSYTHLFVLDKMGLPYAVAGENQVDIYQQVNVTQLVDALKGEECQLISLKERDESLESYFINLVGGERDA